MYRHTVITLALAAIAAFMPKESAMALEKTPTDKGSEQDMVYYKMSTSKGDIYLELDSAKAPISVKNFADYVEAKFYDGTIFHRVMGNFMIQGGGFDATLAKKETRGGIKNEWRNGLKNGRGTIAMARVGGQHDSATSQFFINVVDNFRLDTPQDGAAYAVFGRVLQGMDVVDAIRKVPTRRQTDSQGSPHANAPVEAVIIKSVTKVSGEEIEALRSKAVAEREAAGRKTLDQAADFLKKQGVDASKAEVSDTGLWSIEVKAGTGATPKPTDRVQVHYTGWLTDGSKFDSSRDRGEPATFALNGVIKGWTEGVGAMKVGSRRYLIIPPEMAYGSMGRPKIPANSILVFDVELLDIP